MKEFAMASRSEDAMDRRLRWMTENVTGAYNAQHPDGHPNAGNHCVNSGTCIIVCCYINALGKVLLKGGPPKGGHRRRDFERFNDFLQQCMRDFVTESSRRNWLPTPRGKTCGEEWLYEVFRCGFVHGYPGANVAWGRKPRSTRYWFCHKGRLTLNIDELVKGFQRGIEEFRRLANADTDLLTRFMDYIVAD
jgi:hypothetical protein